MHPTFYGIVQVCNHTDDLLSSLAASEQGNKAWEVRHPCGTQLHLQPSPMSLGMLQFEIYAATAFVVCLLMSALRRPTSNPLRCRSHRAGHRAKPRLRPVDPHPPPGSRPRPLTFYRLSFTCSSSEVTPMATLAHQGAWVLLRALQGMATRALHCIQNMYAAAVAWLGGDARFGARRTVLSLGSGTP